MHNLAENGIAAHWKYKDDEPQSLMKEDQRLQWLREMVELFREQRNPKEFLKNLKINLIPEEVYVFTPKGQVVSLPTGASALDFAFRIHTEIGVRAAGAKINGKPSPLKTLLKTGDIIEIMTSPDKAPTRSLLNIAFTSGARHQIKRWLNQQAKVKSISLGQKLWEKEIRKYNVPSGLPKEEALLQQIGQVVSFRMKSLEDFYALVGLGKIVVNRKFLEKILPSGLEARKKEPLFHKVISKVSKKAAGDIQVRDSDGELVHLAKCCSPIKGEPIIGYITSGKGITAHSLRCSLIANEILDPERLVDVSWGSVAQGSYKAGLLVKAPDSPGLLAKVANSISELEGNITKAEVKTFADQKAQIKFSLVIRDIKHLDAIMKDISKVKGIFSVERI
jgi:GTP pyrophosphokinase